MTFGLMISEQMMFVLMTSGDMTHE